MSEYNMVYEGVNRTINSNQSPLQLFKGPESAIKSRELQDGSLYFATDTKKIYLDCDFTDSTDKTLHDRLAFGGSSGIYFSQKEFGEYDTSFPFEYSKVEKVLDEVTGRILNTPQPDDIIIDTANGSFYRVVSANDDSQYIQTERLTVAGGGGGGGGSGGGGSTSGGKFVGRLVSTNVAFANTATDMPIQYVAYSESDIIDPETGMNIRNPMELIIANVTTGQELYRIDLEQGETETSLVTKNIAPYIQAMLNQEIILADRTYRFGVKLGDNFGNLSSAQQMSITIAKLSIAPDMTEIEDKSTDTEYGVRPNYAPTIVTSPYLTYKVVDQQNASMIYQQGELRELTSGAARKFNVEYRAGRVVHIYTQLFGYVQGKLVSSNVYEQSLMFIDPNNLVPRINILSWPEVRSEGYPAYTEEMQVRYRISYAGLADTLAGKLLIKSTDGSTYYESDEDFEIGKTLIWSPFFEDEGTYYLMITVGAGASMQTAKSDNYRIKGSSGNRPVVTAGAQFDFTPKKTESSSNKDEWSAMWMSPEAVLNTDGTYSLVGEIPIVADFHNSFNWTTNGWRAISGSKNSKLVLNNGAKLTLPVAPFYGQYVNRIHTFDGAISTGKTIEFDVKISNVRDRTKRIIESANYNTSINDWHNKEPVVGVVATGDYFILTSSGLNLLATMQKDGVVPDKYNGLIAHYGADTRVHICYVIANSSTNIDGHFPANYIYTYVNGVLSGVVERDSNEAFKQSIGDNYINITTFDSTYADIEIYNFRFYGSALTPGAVLDNYLANLTNDEAISRKMANDVIENYINESDPSQNYSYVSLSKVKALGTIPYMVLRGGLRCDKKGKPTGNNEVSLPYFTKKDYRYMDGYFVDPANIDRCKGIKDPVYDSNGKIINFTANFEDRWKLIVYCQGTSSLEYPVKNLRIQSVNKKEKYSLFPENPPSKRFTIKADYMDSSMSHNTGTANQLNDLYAGAGIEPEPNTMLRNTNSSYKNYTLLTAIRGRPMVIFWRRAGLMPDGTIKGTETSIDADDRDSLYEYVGRYNFNFDKGEPDLFGFFEDPDSNNYGIITAGNAPADGYDVVTEDIHDSFYAVNKYTDENDKEVEVNYYIGPKTFYRDLDDLSLTWSPTLPTYVMINDPVRLTADELTACQKSFTNQLPNGPLYFFRSGSTTTFTLGPDGPENKTTSAKLVGYRSSIQCWEMKNNNNDLTSFRVPYDYKYDAIASNHDVFDDKTGEQVHVGKPYEIWSAAYESRYPAQLEEGAADKRAFTAFINWLASTNLFTALSEADYTSLVTNNQWQTWLNDQEYKQAATRMKRNDLDALPESQDETTTYLPYPLYDPETGEHLTGDAYNAYKQQLINEAIASGQSEPQEHSAEYKTAYDAYLAAYTEEMTITNRIKAYTIPYTNSTKPFTAVSYNGVEYTHDTQEYRMAKFKAECEQHIDKARTCFYYILTELEVLMDSRAKNMMMVSYTANNETGVGIWYPIFYDMDTQLGVNNTGKLVYRYDVKDTTFGVYNTTADYPRDANGKIDFTRTNLEYSVLWSNFRLAFTGGYDSYVAQMYRTLRGTSLTYNSLMNVYNNDLANAWCESFINQDIYYKYIRPKDEPNWLYSEKGYHVPADESLKRQSENWTTEQWEEFSSPGHENAWALRDTSFADLLYAAQGTRTEHRKQWLKRRMLLLDGKYAADTAAFKFTFRTNVLHGEDAITHTQTDDDVHLEFTADDSSYIWLNFEKNYLTDGHVKGPIYVPEHSTTSIDIPMSHMSSQENETIMMFISNITDFGSLGRVGMANVATVDSTGMNVVFKVRNLDFGLSRLLQQERETKIANPWTTFNGRYFPMLERLNLDYMYTKLTSVNLHDSLNNSWSNAYLREFSAKFSYIQNIEFPQGGVLERVYVPATLQKLKIIDQPLLTTLQCDNNSWRSVTHIWFANSNGFDSKNIVKICLRKDSNNGDAELQYVTLENIEWTLDPTDPEECTLSGNLITSLPILDKLITLQSFDGLPAPWSVAQNKQVNIGYYISGTITINNGQQYGLDAVALSEKYCGCYPNIKLVYTNNDYVSQAFTVQYYDANKTILSKYTKQYNTTAVSGLTANEVFSGLNLRDFSKIPEVSHTYDLIGFKVTAEGDDLFQESIINEIPEVTLAQAQAVANAVIDVKANVSWTVLDNTSNPIYDDSITYYTKQELCYLNNNDYIWTPSEEATTQLEKAQELVDYLVNHRLYIYNGTTYQFVNGFTLMLDQGNAIDFYPVYVSRVQEYRVDFYDDEQSNNPKIATTQYVKYLHNAEPVDSSQVMKIIINTTDYTQTIIKPASYPAVNSVIQDVKVYPTFPNQQNMRDVPTSDNWFTYSINSETAADTTNVSGGILTIKANYPYEAITIPKTYNGTAIIGIDNAKVRTKRRIQMDIDILEATQASYDPDEYELLHFNLENELANAVDLRCIFFEDNNSIIYIKQNAFMFNDNLEYFDFARLTGLKVIGNVASTNLAFSNAVPSIRNGSYNCLEGTFYCCTKLKITALPDTIRLIGAGCFANDPEMKITQMPRDIRIIGSCAFANDKGIGAIEMGRQSKTFLNTIGNGAFGNCSNMHAIDTNIQYQSLSDLGEDAFNGCTQWGMFDVPTLGSQDIFVNETLRIIKKGTFNNCVNLNPRTLPYGIEQIGNGAFQNAGLNPSETNPSIYRGVVVIQNNAFRNSNCINGVTIGYDLTTAHTFGNNIFRGAQIGHFTVNAFDDDGTTNFITPDDIFNDNSLELWNLFKVEDATQVPILHPQSSQAELSLTISLTRAGTTDTKTYTQGWLNRS